MNSAQMPIDTNALFSSPPASSLGVVSQLPANAPSATPGSNAVAPVREPLKPRRPNPNPPPRATVPAKKKKKRNSSPNVQYVPVFERHPFAEHLPKYEIFKKNMKYLNGSSGIIGSVLAFRIMNDSQLYRLLSNDLFTMVVGDDDESTRFKFLESQRRHHKDNSCIVPGEEDMYEKMSSRCVSESELGNLVWNFMPVESGIQNGIYNIIKIIRMSSFDSIGNLVNDRRWGPQFFFIMSIVLSRLGKYFEVRQMLPLQSVACLKALYSFCCLNETKYVMTLEGVEEAESVYEMDNANPDRGSGWNHVR